MVFKSDVGNRPVEYLRHKRLGDMPLSTYGDGIKKVLVLSNAIAAATNGILLIDEIETAIHKRYDIRIGCKKLIVIAAVFLHSAILRVVFRQWQEESLVRKPASLQHPSKPLF